MKKFKGFGSPNKDQKPKVRMELCRKIADQIGKRLHPNGEPPNMRTASWIDYETGDWVFADITNHPDLWDLPAFDVASERRYEAKERFNPINIPFSLEEN